LKGTVRVADSYSILTYFEGEAGAEVMVEVFRAARDSGKDLLLSAIDWGEVYQLALKETGEQGADHVANIISSLPIQIVAIDLALAKAAAEVKSQFDLSFRNCFPAALAKTRRIELVTGNREFEKLDRSLKVLWLN